MKSLQIFQHAVMQVTGNLAQVVRLTAVPLLVTLALMQGMLVAMRGAAPGSRPWFFLVLILGLAVIGTWVAVSFHRMVLLGERFGWIPLPPTGAVLRYLLQTIPFVLLLSLIGVTLGFLGGSFLTATAASGAPSGLAVGLLQLVVSLILAVLTLRLMAMLPGVAIGGGIAGAFRALRGTWPVLLGLAGMLMLLQAGGDLLLRLVVTLVVGPAGEVATPVAIVLSLLQVVIASAVALIGISILTTLYGHYVQGRPLR